MGSKGQSTTNQQQSQTYAPNPQAQSAIMGALGQAQNTASLPFNIPQAPVAGFSNDQQQGFQGVRDAQGAAQPYFNQANNYFQQGTQADVSQFFNPLAGAVGSQLQNIFGQQNLQNTANLTQAAGGVGADRIAVGQANMANQQGLAAGQTFANLYQPALQAAQQQESLLQGAGYGSAALGSAVQNSQLTGANALLGTGGLQQQYQQALLNSPYQQQLAQAAFPYQQSQFLTNAVGSLAPGLGGTTSGYSTGTNNPAQPSIWSQILGGAGVGTALYNGFGGGSGSGKGTTGTAINPGSVYNTGNGQISGGGPTGPTPFYAEGGEVGNPYGAVSDAPINIAGGILPQGGGQDTKIAPHIPQLNFSQPQQGGLPAAQSQGPSLGDIAKLATMFMARGGQVGDRRFDGFDPQAFFDDGGIVNPFISRSPGAHNDNSQRLSLGARPMPKPANDDKPPRKMFARGGYDDGGTIEDRFAPVKEAIADGTFDPAGINATTFEGKAMPAQGAPLPRARPQAALPKEIAGDDTETPSDAMAFAPKTGASPYAPPASRAAPGNLIDAPPEGNAAQDFAKSPWAPLMAAGLGIMGGTSPYAGVNIGQGGLQGMKALEQQRADAQKDTTIAQASKRLAQEAKFHEDQYTRMTPYQKAEVGLQKSRDDRAQEQFERPYKELTRAQQIAVDRQAKQDELAEQKFNRPYEELTAAEKAQLEETRRQHDQSAVGTGMKPKYDENGKLVASEALPGGPHDPAQIRSEADAKRLPAMNKEDMSPMVDAYYAGDHSVLNQVGKGTQGSQNIQQFWGMLAEKLRNEGVDGKQLAAAKANFMAQSAGMRVAAQREANIETAVNEAKGTFPEVLRTSALLPRTEWTPVNAALEYARNKTGSPQQRAFGAAVQAAITAYSQAMSRTGANSVYAQQHAADILSKTDGPEALKASVDQLNIEMGIAQRAPEETRQAILNRILGIKSDQQPATGSPSAASPSTASALPDAAKAQLKEGQVTTFGNGQKWTLKDGQPAQVP